MPMTIDKAQVTLPTEREVRVRRSFKALGVLVYRAVHGTGAVCCPGYRASPAGRCRCARWTCGSAASTGGAGAATRTTASSASLAGFARCSRRRGSCTPKPTTPALSVMHTRLHEAIVTVTFTEEAGVTTVTTLIDFGSKDARDAAAATGMTDGMEQSYQLLDQLISERV